MYVKKFEYYYILNAKGHFLCANPLRFTANNMFALEYVCKHEARRMLRKMKTSNI